MQQGQQQQHGVIMCNKNVAVAEAQQPATAAAAAAEPSLIAVDQSGK